MEQKLRLVSETRELGAWVRSVAVRNGVCENVMMGQGRAAHLIWLSVWKEEIATRRNDYEDACLHRLAETLPPGCRVTVLADSGFGEAIRFVATSAWPVPMERCGMRLSNASVKRRDGWDRRVCHG